MTRYVFLDTETSSLRRDKEIWDLAYIIRDEDERPGQDIEKQWFFEIAVSKADPISLDIGHYWQRHPNPYHREDPDMWDAVARWWNVGPEIAKDLHGAYVVGAVPWFDTEVLERTLRKRCEIFAPHHYHLVDIEAMAAGRLGMAPPWNFDKVLAEFGLEYPDGQPGEAGRHSALGDARMVRYLFDQVLAG